MFVTQYYLGNRQVIRLNLTKNTILYSDQTQCPVIKTIVILLNIFQTI